MGYRAAGAGYGLLHVVAYRADAEHRQVVAVVQSAACAHLDFLQRAAPVLEDTAAPWIADDERSLVGQLGRVHQPAQLVLVHGRGDGEVGDGAQGCQVEGSVVGGAVLADQSGAVKAEDDVEPEQGHVVYDMVVGPLCEGRIDQLVIWASSE